MGVSQDGATPAERVIAKARQGSDDSGQKLSRTSLQYQRTLENYLKAGNRPRWMERVVEIDRGTAEERQRLERAYGALREEVGHATAEFARRWREIAESWDFSELNVLIRQHNEWYPIERQLPVDIRTRDYVLVHGRSFRRPILDAGWILEQFPA